MSSSETGQHPTGVGLHGAADYGLSADAGPDHQPWAETLDRIGAERSWWLGTTRSDGRPHTMPVWGLVVGGRIIFSTDPKSVKAKNLAGNSAVTLHLPSGDDVVIVEGTVSLVSDLPDGFGAAYQAKYDVEIDFADMASGIFEIEPTKAFSWDESSFVETAVRWLFSH